MKLNLIFFCALFIPATLFSSYSPMSGRPSPERYSPSFSVQEHYDLAYQQLHNENWDAALSNSMVIIYHFKESPFYHDALFYSGVCYYFKNEFDLANQQLNRYLTLGNKLKYFEKVFEFKLEIAKQYSTGYKKHLFGVEALPKFSSTKSDAIALYDEIIAALPGKEISALALYNKAKLVREKREYKESIEALQILCRQFPKHSLAADGYLCISEIYLEQSKLESQNPDLLSLAQVNIQKFSKSFPADDRIEETKNNLLSMKEVYAQSLHDTGKFYERKKKWHACTIYYKDSIQKYPETEAASKSRDRLAKLSLKDES